MTSLSARARRSGVPSTEARAGRHGAIRLTPRQRRYLRCRRWVDLVIGGAGLLVAVIPMLIISFGVLATMGRPVLFTQERVTQDGRVFRLRKFRSMRTPSQCGTDDDAARIVPFGRLLRETSLDELPSLWNVVRGDMSLVGPRPLTTDYLTRYSSEQHARHVVPAGLTGYAQVSGRNALGWDRRLALDLEYVCRMGPILDLQIIAATVVTVLRRHGVTDGASVSMSDFPGPQSTSYLELDGPDDGGAWSCRDRKGVTLVHGGARVLEPGLVELEILLGPRCSAVAEPLLDDALLLLISRIRVVHRAKWAVVHSRARLPEALAAALAGTGFVPVGEGAQSPRALHPLSRSCGGARCQIAFLGFPDDEGAPPLPSSVTAERERRGAHDHHEAQPVAGR